MRVIRFAAKSAGSILLLAACILTALHTPPARRMVFDQARAALARRGVSLEAARIDYNLLTLTARLTDLRVRSVSALELPAFASAGLLNADLDLAALLLGRIRVQEITARGLDLHVVIDERGHSNIPQLAGKRRDRADTDWLITLARLSSGAVTFEDRRRGLVLTLPAWRLEVDGNAVSRDHAIRFALDQPGTLQFQQQSHAIDALSLNATLRDRSKAVEIGSLHVRASGADLDVSGEIRDLRAPVLALRLAAALPVERVTSLTGVKETLAGLVKLDGSLRGPVSGLRLAARLSGQGLTVARFRRVDVAAAAEYTVAEGRLSIASFRLASTVGRVDARGELALADRAEASRLEARAEVALDVLSAALRLPFKVASRASASVSARWPGLDYRKGGLEATISLRPMQPEVSRNLVPISGLLRATARNGSVAVDVDRLSAFDAVASGRLTLDGNRLGGNLELDLADSGATLVQLGRVARRQDLLAIDLHGASRIAVDLHGSLSRPAATVSLRAPNLKVAKLTGVAAELDATLDSSHTVIERGHVQWNGQSAVARGSVAWTSPDSPIDLSVRIEEASIPEILRGLGRQDVPVGGRVSAGVRVSGAIHQPEVTLTVAASHLEAYGEPFGDLAAEARVEGNVARLVRLRLDRADGLLKADGNYDLSSGSYSLDAEVSGFRLRQFSPPVAGPVAGVVNLTARGSGTLDRPALTARLDAGELSIRGDRYGSLRATLDLAGDMAKIQAEAPDFNLTIEGQIGVRGPYPARFDLVARGTDLSRLPLQPRLEGRITANATVRGGLSAPEALEVSAEIRPFDIAVARVPIHTAETLSLGFDPTRGVTIGPAKIMLGDSWVRLDGSLPLDDKLTGGHLNLSGQFNLTGLVPLIPAAEPLQPRGRLELEAVLRGSLKKLAPSADIALRGGEFSIPGLNAPFGNVELDARIESGALALRRLSASWASGRIDATGEAPFSLLPENLPMELPRKTGPLQLTLDAKGLQLASLPGIPKKIAGTVSIHLEAQAPRAELPAVRAELSLPELSLDVGEYPLRQQGISRVTVENGLVTVRNLEFAGTDTRITVEGQAGLVPPEEVNLKMDGSLNAAVLSAFTDQVAVSGSTRLALTLTGALAKPRWGGTIDLIDGRIARESPAIVAEGVSGRLELSPELLRVVRLNGVVNGGTLDARADAGLSGGELQSLNLNAALKNFYLDFPEGLQTVSNADLKLEGNLDEYLLSGNVAILEGSYTQPITLEGGLLRYLRSGSRTEFAEERNPLLSKLKLAVGVRTGSPLTVDNNLARAEVALDVRVSGTAERTGLVGRVNLEEGGELYLNERTYIVERGIVTFTNDQRIEPSLDILARTRAADYDITLRASGGGASRIETRLSADPPLPEPDIIAVLVTGRTLSEARGAESEIVKEQTLSYLAGSLGGGLSRQVQRTLGLSKVSIEPNLIAAETEPTARLTIGQDITGKLGLIYSTNLRDSSDQIWIGEYQLTKRFGTRAIRQNDNSYRFEFRHRMQFGAVPEPAPGPETRVERRIGKIAFTGSTVYSEKDLLKRLKVKTGSRYDFFKVREGLRRVEDLYAKDGHLEARIRLERKESANTVDLAFEVRSGPRVEFAFEGRDVSKGTRNKIRRSWRDGVFDEQRIQKSRRLIKEELISDGYLVPDIDASVTATSAGRKLVSFRIKQGVRYRNVDVAFEGTKEVSPSRLASVAAGEGFKTRVHSDPGHVTDSIQRYYRQLGYLDAIVEAPRYELNPATASGRVVLRIEEGPLYRLGTVSFFGSSAIPSAELAAAAGLETGAAFTPGLQEDAYTRLQDLYFRKGFAEVDIRARPAKRAGDRRVDVVYEIAENRQRVVAGIHVAGNRNTSEGLIRSQMGLQPGDIAGNAQLSRARRNLYNTNAYSFVDLELRPGDRASLNLAPNQHPVWLDASVHEVRPWDLRYGAYFDTERGPGGIADIANRNMLGSTRVVGLRTRYDSDLREARFYFTQPSLLRFPVSTNVTSFFRREIREAFITDRRGLTAEQEARLGRRYLLTLGYRFEATHTFDKEPDALVPFDVRLRIAPLATTLTRETRDDLLDATRGSFLSQAFEYAPGFLGSQVRFVRSFSQYFRYVPLGRSSVVPWLNQSKTRFLYAGGVRLGLATGLGGQDLIPSERFFAGGGTTIRGFQQDRAGPLDLLGEPRGGNAMLIVNNELRFPVFHIFDGVGFIDLGNVYQRVSDFAFSDIRKSAGVGLRVRTPYFLLRLDYGFKLDRRPGEGLGRLFFSIGQAF